jgi:hypothetical protein
VADLVAYAKQAMLDFTLHRHCNERLISFTRCRRRYWWWSGPPGIGDPTWDWPERPHPLPGRGFFTAS